MSIIRFEGFEGYSSFSEVKDYINITPFQSANIVQSNRTYWSNYSDMDSFFDKTVLLLDMEGTNNSTLFLDTSLRRRTPSRIGNPIISTSQKQSGQSSGYFNGNSYLSFGTGSDWDFSANNGIFTIEGWIYNSNPNNFNGIIGSRQNGTGSGWCLYISTNNTFYTGSIITGQSYTDRQLNTTVIPANTWTHFALVKNATNYICYINGIAGSPINLSNGFDYRSDRPLVVGALGSEGEYPFSGYIDDIRITKGVSRYSSNFTPPSRLSPGLSPHTLCKSDNFLVLSSSYSNNISYFPKIKIFNDKNIYNECTVGFKYYLDSTQTITSFDPIAIIVDSNEKPHFYICVNSNRQLEIRRWNTAAAFGAASTNYTAASYVWNATPVTYNTSAEYCDSVEADHFIHTIGNPGCGNVQRHTYTLDGTNKMVLLGASTTTLLSSSWNNIEVSFKIDNASSNNNGYVKAKINRSLYDNNLDINLTSIRTSTQNLNSMHGIVLGLVWNGTSKDSGLNKFSYYDDFYWLNSESASDEPKSFLGPILCSKETLNTSISNSMTSGDLSSVNEVFSGSGIYSLPAGTLGQLTSTFTGQNIEVKANNQDKDYPLYAVEAYAFAYKNNQGSLDISTKNNNGIIRSLTSIPVVNNKITRFVSSFANNISVFPKFKYYKESNTYNEFKIKFDYYLNTISQPISSFIPIAIVVDSTDKPHLYICVNSNRQLEIRQWNTAAAFGAASTNYTAASYVWNATPVTYNTSAEYCDSVEADHFIHTIGNPGCGNVQRHTYTLDGTNKMVLLGTSSINLVNESWNTIDLSILLDNTSSSNTGYINLAINNINNTINLSNIRTSTQNNNTAGGIVIGAVWNGTTKNTGSSLWRSDFRNFEWYSISAGVPTLITPTTTPSTTTLQPTDVMMSADQKYNNISTITNNKLSDLNFVYSIS